MLITRLPTVDLRGWGHILEAVKSKSSFTRCAGVKAPLYLVQDLIHSLDV